MCGVPGAPDGVLQTRTPDADPDDTHRSQTGMTVSPHPMEATTPSVSIVMPCLNEAGTVADCVARARQALEVLAETHGLVGEIIVADNGSTDGSQDRAGKAGATVVTVEERGYGAALIGGFRAARGRYLIMGDSDCSYDFVEAVPMVETLMAGADVCMGSRFMGDIRDGAMPWKNRYIGNPVLSFGLGHGFVRQSAALP